MVLDLLAKYGAPLIEDDIYGDGFDTLTVALKALRLTDDQIELQAPPVPT